MEWFGLILLPVMSFAAEALVTVIYFLGKLLFMDPAPPEVLAKGRTIDLSIQFALFWMPFVVLLAWWTDKPFFLLFGVYAESSSYRRCAINPLEHVLQIFSRSRSS